MKSDTVGEDENDLITVFQFDQSKVTIPKKLIIWGWAKMQVNQGLKWVKTVNLTNVKKGLALKKMLVNQGLKWQWVNLLNVKIVDNQGR